MRSHRGWMILAAAVCLAAVGCAAPVGVELTDPRRVHENLVRSALTGDEPSSFSTAVLLRTGLYDAFEEYPELTLERMRLDIHWAVAEDALFALAELSFLHAERRRSPRHYLAAAVYAYAFLFPDDPAEVPSNFDPRHRIASDLYNRGVTRGFADPDGGHVELRDGSFRLPFGRIQVDLDEADLFWGPYELVDFQASADLAVRGLRNRYRFPGIGAPFDARTRLLDSSEIPVTPVPDTVRLPVTALLAIESPRQGIHSGELVGRIDLFAADTEQEVEIGGEQVPLEFETTSALASTLSLSRFWESELAGFFGRVGIRPAEQFGDGLFMLHPYVPGRIPLVLVHGTASSPARWAELVNEVLGVPILRENYQIWLFTYDTGQPVSFSAGLLCESLRLAVEALDTDGTDPALSNLIVMGHSQGGLLTKMTAISSGDRFWPYEVALDDLDLEPSTAHVLRRSLFFEPLPFVKRVVFLATPHRGSYLTLWKASGYVARLVTLPVWVVGAFAEALERNPSLAEHHGLEEIPTAIDDMRPSNPFLQTLVELPIADHVAAHSIIAVKGDGPVENGSDGVVKYRSAHLEGVRSEHIVRSGHSAQPEIGTILEMGRILIEHLVELGLETPAAQASATGGS